MTAVATGASETVNATATDTTAKGVVADAPKTDAKAPAADKAATPKLGEPEKVTPPKLGDAPPAEKEGEGEAKKGEAAEPEKPLVYDFGKAPEGSTYREPVIDAYKAVAAKHKVSPEAAKDILDTMLPVLQADGNAQVKAHIEETTAKWSAELQQRHGDKLGDVMRLANSALAKASTPALTAFLRDSALAVNPDFIDLLAAFGQRVTNDRSVSSREHPAPRQLSPEEEMAAQYDRNEAERAASQRG